MIESAPPAVFSPDRKYRYVLRRRVGLGDGTVLFVMANPSIAAEEVNDHTITRDIDFANRWGFGWLVVCNLYAYCSTEPKELRRVIDPVGPENDAHLLREAKAADQIVVAWGELDYFGRAKVFYQMALAEDFNSKLVCLGKVNASGQPRHPLFVERTVERITWPRVSARPMEDAS